MKAEITPVTAEQTPPDQSQATDRAAAVTTAATLVGRADVTVSKSAPASAAIDPSAGVGAEPVPVEAPTGTVVAEPKKAPEPAAEPTPQPAPEQPAEPDQATPAPSPAPEPVPPEVWTGIKG